MAQTPLNLNAADVFRHADTFYQALDNLHTKSPKDTLRKVGMPIMVISAFACELMLKCLVLIDTGSTPRKHGLYDLYKLLKPATQDSLKAAWSSVSQQRSEILDQIDASLGYKRPRDLESHLESGNDAFVQLRYVYEGGDDFDFRLSDFPIVLREQIRSMKPEFFT